MNSREERLVRSLFILAQDVDPVRNARLSACITFRGEVVGYGFNQFKSHPLQARFAVNENSIYLHAEIDAIKNALRRCNAADLRSATLYVARAKKNRKKQWVYGLAKPCDGCLCAIQSYGIRQVYYTLDGGGHERDERV